MIKLHNYTIPTDLSEITLNQWLKITNVIQEEHPNWIQKYFQILEILNVPDSVLDLITDVELFEWIALLNKNIATELPTRKSITIDGEVFFGYQGDKFELKARDILYIETEFSNGGDLLRTVAIIFKSNNPEIKSHYNPEEIARKAILFADQPASFFIPYLVAATQNLVTKIIATNAKSITK